MAASSGLVLVKTRVLCAHDAPYAGGVNLFASLARALPAAGCFEAGVHVVSTASKALLLHHAVAHGLLRAVTAWRTGDGGEVVSWRDPALGITHHVVVTQEEAQAGLGRPLVPSGAPSSAAAAALLAAVATALSQLRAAAASQCLVLLDVDGLQHATVADGAGAGGAAPVGACRPPPQQQQQQQPSACVPFMWALQTLQSPSGAPAPPHAAHQRALPAQQPQLLLLVQNVHHLPFGPCGTAPRSTRMLQAWRRASGVICVSSYVRDYLLQHAGSLLALRQDQLAVAPPPAFGAFGSGPFTDLGPAAAARLWGDEAGHAAVGGGDGCGCGGDGCGGDDCGGDGCGGDGCGGDGCGGELAQAGAAAADSATVAGQPGAPVQRGEPASPAEGHNGVPQDHAAAQARPWQQPGQPSQQPASAVVVGMLKLTREKGSDIFLALARRLPSLQFLAVCAEPALLQQAAAAGLPPNVQLMEPRADVAAVLSRMTLLLVPSVLHEAYGMVVLDAMVHGLPVLVSSAGALSEAASGAAAAVLPVATVVFPPTAAGAAQHAAAGQAGRVGSAASASATPGPSTDAATPTCCSSGCDDHGGSPAPSTADGVAAWLAGERAWSSRVHQEQQASHVQAWADAVLAVTASREGYVAASQRSRAAGLAAVAAGSQQLQQLLLWMRGITSC